MTDDQEFIRKIMLAIAPAIIVDDGEWHRQVLLHDWQFKERSTETVAKSIWEYARLIAKAENKK